MSASAKMGLLKIDLDDLRKITDQLFEHIIRVRGENEIVVDKVFYWEIPFDQLLDMEMKLDSLDITVGSLQDDWDFLSLVLSENSCPVARQLTQLSALFRFIGERLGEKLASEGG